MAGKFRRRSIVTGVFAAALAPGPVHATPMKLRQVVSLLRGPSPANFAGQDLSRLDLADLNFSGANLVGATLFGADLSGARFTGADLSRANLDRTIMIRTDFTDANLSGATMFLPAATALPGTASPDDAPRFCRANLSGAQILAKLVNCDWTGATLAGAHLELGRTQFLAALRSDLSGGRMANTNLTGANLTGVRMAFADLRGARMIGTQLRGADLAGAMLTGADVTGADLGLADLYRASMHGVIGLDQAIDVATARNFERMER